MKCHRLPSAVPHVVWVFGDSLTDKLDAATWLETSRELSQMGWCVTLVVAGPAGDQSIPGVELVSIPRPDVYLVRRVVFHVRLLGFVARGWAKIDVILFHAMSAPWVMPLLLVRRLRGMQRPLLVMDTRDVDIPSGDPRSRLRTLVLRFAHRLANRWADGQTAITQRMADLEHIASQHLWGTWPSGVDLARFAPARDVRLWPSGEEPIRLVYVGALLPERNLLSLCQAVEEANALGMRFLLTIVGKGAEQPRLERCALRAPEAIVVQSPVPPGQIPRLLALAHVGVTSLFSPDDKRFQASSPIKLFEYMAAGLPILSTKIVCHTDVVGNRKFGFWAEDASVAEMIAALRLIWRARASLERMGEEAATAVQSWTWQRSATKLKMALERGLQMRMAGIPSCEEELRCLRESPGGLGPMVGPDKHQERTDVAEKIRVLAVTNTYPTDKMPGDTPCVKDQILALRAKGLDVDLLHVDRSGGRLSYARAARRLLSTSFQGKRYDLIHAYYGHCGLLARLQLSCPVVVTFRGSDLLSRRDGALGRLVARLVDGVIVMTEEMKRVANRDDAFVIPFGVNFDLFAPYPMERARRDLGLPLSDRLALFPWDPSRREKRFDIVEEAVRTLQDEQEKVRLVVIFDKPHEVVAKYLNACDVMVLASNHEGSPMAVREAMACNLPIVSVDVGDVRQMITGTEGCYLCKQEAGDVAKKVRRALRRGGRTDGASVVSELDAARAAEEVISVYNLVLQNRARM